MILLQKSLSLFRPQLEYDPKTAGKLFPPDQGETHRFDCLPQRQTAYVLFLQLLFGVIFFPDLPVNMKGIKSHDFRFPDEKTVKHGADKQAGCKLPDIFYL